MALGGIITSLGATISGATAKTLTALSLNVVATKMIIVSIFVVLLPIVVNNILHSLLTSLYTLIGSQTLPALETAFSYSGLLGYFFNVLGLDDCLAILISCGCYRLMLSFIPFVGPK